MSGSRTPCRQPPARRVRADPLYLYASSALRHRYEVRLPSFELAGVDVTMSVLERPEHPRPGHECLTGLTSTDFSASDLEQLQRYWIGREMRPQATWAELLKTFDVKRQYRVRAQARQRPTCRSGCGPGPRGDHPAGAGPAKAVAQAGPRRATVQQLTTKGEVVGGSTLWSSPPRPFHANRGDRCLTSILDRPRVSRPSSALADYGPFRQHFWYDWGPIFYRGRLDGSARCVHRVGSGSDRAVAGGRSSAMPASGQAS